MALKIKKQIKDPQTGLVTEIEGTEAEVEAFLRKHEKMKETPKPKKDLILGKGVEERIRQLIAEELGKRLMTHEQLAEFVRRNAPHQQPQHIHHWYHDNGWWWRPYWTGITWTYQYTNQDPARYDGVNGSPVYSVFNTSDEMSSHLGFTNGYVESKVSGTPYLGIATNGVGSASGIYSSQSTAKLLLDSNQNWASNNLKLGGHAASETLITTTAEAVPMNFVGYCAVAPSDGSN